MIDTRRIFSVLENSCSALDDSDSYDLIDCLLFETTFSCIMILLSAESYAEYVSRINAWFDVWFSSWLIQDNVIESFCRWSTEMLRLQQQDLRVLYRSRIARVRRSQYYVKNDN